MRRLTHWLAQEVGRIERAHTPAWYFLLTFLSATTLRTFFELFSDRQHGAFPAAHFFDLLSGVATANLPFMLLHYTLFYGALALSLMLVLSAAARQDLREVARLVAAGFIVLLVVPVADLILSGGAGYDLTYLIPGEHGSLLSLFLTFFGPLTDAGVSPGMRIEVAVVTLSIFAFFFLYKGRSLVRSALCALIAYAVIFAYIAAPYFTDPLFSFVGAAPQYSDLAGIRFFGLLVLAQLLVVGFLLQRNLSSVFFGDLRFFRLMHYWAMFFFGVLLCALAGGSMHLTTETATVVPLMLLAILGAWGFSVATNNLEDVDIDRVTNPDRPLIAGGVTDAEYKLGTLVLFFGTLAAAALSGFAAFFAVSVFLGSYFLYSMPPLRLKRVPYFSKLAIVINSAVLFCAGFAAFNILPARYIGEFFAGVLSPLPPPLLLLLPWVLLLAANFIDLKDYAGDKAGGIKTLPVLLGERRAKLLIGGAFLFLYTALSALLFDGFLAAVGILLGVAQFYLINKKEYQEAPVFSLYLMTLAGLFLSFL